MPEMVQAMMVTVDCAEVDDVPLEIPMPPPPLCAQLFLMTLLTTLTAEPYTWRPPPMPPVVVSVPTPMEPLVL